MNIARFLIFFHFNKSKRTLTRYNILKYIFKDMHIKPSYSQIKNLLNIFFKYKISEYNTSRNFTYFAEDTLKNVSGLSLFISRGLVKEEHLLKKIIH